MANQSLNLPYLILTGTILVAILAVFGWFRPLWQDTKNVRAEIQTTQATLTERQGFLLTIDRKKGELQQEQQHEQQLSIMLPSDPAMDDVTRLIQRLSQSAGVVVNNMNNDSDSEQVTVNALRVKSQQAVLPETIVPLAINLEVKGSYQQFRNFLEQLEHTVRLMDVTSLELVKDESQVDQITAKLHIRLYQQAANDQPHG